MAFKMKGNPLSRLATTKSHGTNANYKKSGAPGLLGKILDPIGLFRKKGGKGGRPCPPAGGDPAALPGTAPAQAPPAAAAPAAAAPAAAAPPVEEPAPTQMRKQSPAKDIKSWTAAEMNKKGSKWVEKDVHNDKHRNKQVDADHKPIKRDKKANPKK